MLDDPRLNKGKLERREKALVAVFAAMNGESPDAWVGVTQALKDGLREDELACMALGCLRALPAELADEVFNVLFLGTLDNPNAWQDGKIQVGEWVRSATVFEKKDFIREAVKHLPRRDLDKLKQWVETL